MCSCEAIFALPPHSLIRKAFRSLTITIFCQKKKKRMVFFWLFLTPRLGIKACLVIIPLLGVTWLFGLLLPVHKAFAYIFTILNSTQVSVEWLLSKIIQSRLNFLTRRYNITIVTWYLLELWKEKAVNRLNMLEKTDFFLSYGLRNFLFFLDFSSYICKS